MKSFKISHWKIVDSNIVFAVSDMPKTHEDCLKLVCAVCTNLGGYKAKRGISVLDESRIQKFVFAGFSKASIYSPQGLCAKCYSFLRRKAEEADLDQETGQHTGEFQDLGQQDGGAGDSGQEGSVTGELALEHGMIGDLVEKNRDRKKQDIVFLLPENYHCKLPHNTRHEAKQVCSCRWCEIARLNGGEFNSWQRKMKEQREGRPEVRHICQKCGTGIPVSQKSHICSIADKAVVKNMLQSIPPHLKPKLVHSLLRELQEDQEGKSKITITPASGGKAVPVHLGSGAGSTGSMTQKISIKDLIQSGSKNHLSGTQLASQAADLRAVLGHNVVEPGLQKEIIVHNNRLAQFFTTKELPFTIGPDEETKNMPVFFCPVPVLLIAEVKRLRGVNEETYNLIQGDSGQGWTKIGLSIIKKKDLEREPVGIRLPAAGLHCMKEEAGDLGPGPSKRKRRTRAEGVYGGQSFKDWGARRMILLAVVRTVPESYVNLKVLFDAINSQSFAFKLTGDFAFLMPLIGCVKGCSSCNPCPLCDIRRTKVGGGKARWVEEEDVSLRTLGEQFSNYAGWVMDGEKQSAAATSTWKSVCGEPMLAMIEGQSYAQLILQIVVPGPLHIYLSLNEVINHAEKTICPNIKDLFKQVAGVQFHVYQGRIGNYQGPQINKIFRHLPQLEAHFLGGSYMRYFFTTFQAFRDVAQVLFSEGELQPCWREKLHHLRTCILILSSRFGMPVTPKLHILIVHIEQWVDMFCRPLGREGEQGGEAVHHVWLRLLETLGEPKDKSGSAFVRFAMKALLIFNSNNV